MARYTCETEEHLALREQARRWAAREMAPVALVWDAAAEFPRELYKSSTRWAALRALGYVD